MEQKTSKGKVWKIFLAGVLSACILLMTAIPAAYAAAPAGSMTASYLWLIANKTNAIGWTTVTDSGAEITAANDIKILIPSTFTQSTWDVTDTTAAINTAGNTTGAVSTTVSYGTTNHTNDTLILDVTADFTSGDTVSFAGLSIVNVTLPTTNSSFSYMVDGSTWSSGSDAMVTYEDFGLQFPNDNGFLLDEANTFGHCDGAYPAGLGGSWNGPTKTCTVSSTVTVTDKQLVVTHGVTLNGGGNVTLNYTGSFVSPGDPTGLLIVGGDGDAFAPTDAAVVDDIIITGNNNIVHGAVLTGYDTTLSNSNITGIRKTGITVSRFADTFTLDTNTTSNNSDPSASYDSKGVVVEHDATTGTISNHTASNNESHGIELVGTTDVDVTTPILTGNGGYGLYVRDITWSVEYGGGLTDADATAEVTGTYVNSGTMTGNGTDVVVDVGNGSAWDALQSTATNTYVTLTEVTGTFPGTKLAVQVPEFSDYMLMLTLLISVGFMFKVVPKINTGLRPVA